MARQTQVLEFNSFVGGLITEASPLTFPENAALHVNNFNLSKDGSLSRRLGMDFESDYEVIDSGESKSPSGEVAVSTFTWENAGGDPSNSVIVVQVGTSVKFFDTNDTSLSKGLIHSYEVDSTDSDVVYSVAVVDGVLVLATGTPELVKFTYSNGVIEEETFRLKTRDLFGVQDMYQGRDLRSAENLSIRPQDYYTGDSVTEQHIYNLRNSTFAVHRLWGGKNGSFCDNLLLDPIKIYAQYSLNEIPSNSDSVVSALFADTEEESDRLVERFFPEVLKRSPIGNTAAPSGYFVIDVLDRGTSRLQQVARLAKTVYPSVAYQYKVTSLPLDKTPGGTTLVSEFAGRMWYGGFSGDVIDPDKHSPKLSSYLFYSQLVSSTADLSACHQLGDPTSKESPDLVDTDGGYIRLDGAYGLKKLLNIGSALICVATNGVWAVLGGSDYGFTATDNQIIKISEHGCVGSNSVVLADSSAFYWGDDGIYQVGRNEVGDLAATNITSSTIQKHYNEIAHLDKTYVQGSYDSFERKIRWLYGNRVGDVDDSTELILDLALGAFYLSTVTGVASGKPNVVAALTVPPFKVGQVVSDIVYGDELVFHEDDQVTVETSATVNGIRETMYVSITESEPTIKYTFSQYKDTDFIDWKTLDGAGVDTPAVLITGYDGGGDYQRYKQDPYITFHFIKTEDGFYEDEEGDIYPTHESSCKVQAQWEWANSTTSGRWGREFQAYRHKRHYIPESTSDGFDNGFHVVSSKNKLRGKGKVLSLQIKTEPGKDCKLLGWSRLRSVADNV